MGTIVTLVPRETTPARPVGERPADDGIDDGIAPVVPLRPVTMYGNAVHRLIQPVDAEPGTRLTAHGDPAGLSGSVGYDPGPLARALMSMAAPTTPATDR
jgi:hypothetical protein